MFPFCRIQMPMLWCNYAYKEESFVLHVASFQSFASNCSKDRRSDGCNTCCFCTASESWWQLLTRLIFHRNSQNWHIFQRENTRLRKWHWLFSYILKSKACQQKLERLSSGKKSMKTWYECQWYWYRNNFGTSQTITTSDIQCDVYFVI